MAEISQQDAVEVAERARTDAHELSWALRAVIRASADVDEDLARRLDLRPLDYAAMNHVMTSERPLGPAELSARLGISSGSGTELVDRLERGGHLHRRPHPSDRRRVGLHPTDTAAARIIGALRPLFDDLDALAGDFTPAEQEVISRYLRAAQRRLAAFHRRTDAPGRPARGAPD